MKSLFLLCQPFLAHRRASALTDAALMRHGWSDEIRKNGIDQMVRESRNVCAIPSDWNHVRMDLCQPNWLVGFFLSCVKTAKKIPHVASREKANGNWKSVWTCHATPDGISNNSGFHSTSAEPLHRKPCSHQPASSTFLQNRATLPLFAQNSKNKLDQVLHAVDEDSRQVRVLKPSEVGHWVLKSCRQAARVRFEERKASRTSAPNKRSHSISEIARERLGALATGHILSSDCLVQHDQFQKSNSVELDSNCSKAHFSEPANVSGETPQNQAKVNVPACVGKTVQNACLQLQNTKQNQKIQVLSEPCRLFSANAKEDGGVKIACGG